MDRHRAEIDPELTKNVISSLKGAFVWESTPQGQDYWESVVNELNRVINFKQSQESK